MESLQTVAKKWQKKWQEAGLFTTKEDHKKKKLYVLEMFPYPSGSGLHMGHARNYTIGDVYARFKRMQGFNVLYPMGYDAFGLPAENAAIKAKSHPRMYTEKAIKNFERQQQELGLSYDWSRMISTCAPEYYRWNQWFFVQFFKKGLAYKKQAAANWCNSCQTVLANEQVKEGTCWRCHNPVQIKHIDQWFFKITQYADHLLRDIDKLECWPERIKSMQRNWIGKSHGTLITFKIQDSKKELTVFTTRPDTLYGVTFLTLAPEHPLVTELTKGTKEEMSIKTFIDKVVIEERFSRAAEDQEKEGMPLGKVAIHPLTGEEIPLYTANFVLMDYGTGVVMGVPAHDQRDYDFAQKYNLSINPVITPEGMKCVIVHGSPEKDKTKEPDYVPPNKKHWFSWIKRELQEHSCEVFTPLMPKPWLPNYADWKKEFEKIDVNEKTILIGHSAGAAFLVRWLGETKKKIKKLILVAPGKISANDRTKEMYNFKISQEIKKLTDEIVIFISNDAQHHVDSAKLYEKELDGKLIKLENKGHFTTVTMGKGEFPELLVELENQAYTGEGVLVNSDKFSGLPSSEARERITDHLIKLKKGERTTNFKLRDWLISRQRYWGTPIPIVYCSKCGTVPVPEKELPVLLPEKVTFTGEGNPLANTPSFVNTTCPACKGKAKRETDTMDTFVDSSWYFLRYCDPQNDKKPFDPKEVAQWLPVDQYIGGAEHAVMHLLYARFFTKVLKDLGLISFDEPFIKLFNQGMLHKEGFVMSKSRGNVVTQEEMASKYGIDTARVYLMSMASPDKDTEWDDKDVEGSHRFLQKVMYIITEKKEGKQTTRTEHKQHTTIREVTTALEELRHHDALRSLMRYANMLSLQEAVSKAEKETLALLLAPCAPHLAEECWEVLGNKPFISASAWPKLNEKKIDARIDAADDLLTTVRTDIGEIMKLVKIVPKTIKLISSPAWKYAFVHDLKAVDSRDMKTIISKMKDKTHVKEGMSLIQSFIKGNINVDLVLNQHEEIAALEEMKTVLEKEFQAKAIIERAEDSTEQKARNALPGKPAILLSS